MKLSSETPIPGTPASRGLAAGSVAFAFVIVTVVGFLSTRGGEPAADGGRAPGSTRGPTSPGAAGPLSGTLVFARAGTSDRAELWRWDLASGSIEEGPTVPRPLEIVNASAAGEGWVGLTWRRRDGRLQSGVLSSMEVGTVPTPLLAGDLVSWGARGGRVSAAVRGAAAGCERRITVRGLQLVPRLREPTFRTTLCGDVMSLGRAGTVTYLTLRERERIAVAYAGGEEPRIVLADHALASISWARDMLVQPATYAASVAPFGREPALPDGSSVVLGTGLGYLSGASTDRDAPPAPYVVGDEPFTLDRVLAWAPDAFEALVVGWVDGRPGLYVLDTLPGNGIAAPVRVGRAAGPTWATYTGDAIAIVVTRGDVLAIDDDGVVRELEVPPGSPTADGPVAWLP